MRIKIDKITFLDYLKCKLNTDKVNIWGSFMIIYFYIMMKTKHNIMMSIYKRAGLGILAGFAGIILIYGIIFSFKYRKLKMENMGIKARFEKDSIKEFTIFGHKREYKLQTYKGCNKRYETKSAFFFRFDRMNVLFIPKKYLSEEEKIFISKKIKE